MSIVSYGLPGACDKTHTPMLTRQHFELKETAVTIIAESEYVQTAKDAIFDARSIIERKISDDPFFGTTFEPYRAEDDDDPLIQRMCEASVLTDVGPMAAVAGAVATYAAERMKDAGATYGVIENGGDIAIFSDDRSFLIGLYAGDPEMADLAFNMLPEGKIKGVCSSSAKVGPSISFGDSDICTIVSDDVILADAAATLLGNLLKDGRISEALETVMEIPGIDGCMAYCDGKIAMIGNLPELTCVRVPEDKITRRIYE